jgi:hypothetical protein
MKVISFLLQVLNQSHVQYCIRAFIFVMVTQYWKFKFRNSNRLINAFLYINESDLLDYQGARQVL